MNRKEFLAASGAGVAAAGMWGRDERLWRIGKAPDHSLRISEIKLELAPGKIIRTVAYNGAVPGPILRMRAGVPVTIDVTNETKVDEFVHWHGLHIPGDVDGAMEEGTPPIRAHSSRSYTFTPDPIGTRWYHSHTFAGKDFARSTYSGQFGFLMIDPPSDPGRHDQEIFLALHDWDAYITGGDDGFEMVGYKYRSINGRLLGAADPIRVREGERVLLHALNASASETHWLALPGHRFTVLALDGNAVPNPVSVDQLRLDAGERIDAIVEMNAPGVWIIGEPRDVMRTGGMGVVVEYAGKSGPPQWITPAKPTWDYLAFGDRVPRAVRDEVPENIPLMIQSVFKGHGDFEHWAINGKSFPQTDSVALTRGKRYRMVLNNLSAEDHPVHLHRHTFEITKFAGKATSGLRKDVVTVPASSVVEADFTAVESGKSLFHCHFQDHMDAGFMTLFDCST